MRESQYMTGLGFEPQDCPDFLATHSHSLTRNVTTQQKNKLLQKGSQNAVRMPSLCEHKSKGKKARAQRVRRTNPTHIRVLKPSNRFSPQCCVVSKSLYYETLEKVCVRFCMCIYLYICVESFEAVICIFLQVIRDKVKQVPPF